ncbi:ABC transporter permease subunit [Janibacter hoylei]|uniref:ABC transporter permease subunit n=1 Tax=Janibacter hoylei TaxID=364298 RepID=UPI00223726E3|nr:ABC transporter permease subunit [Janibacter hoylei]MCW4602444.1 ABC transporter permease subunit [Janibacter hoylei]
MAAQPAAHRVDTGAGAGHVHRELAARGRHRPGPDHRLRPVRPGDLPVAAAARALLLDPLHPPRHGLPALWPGRRAPELSDAARSLGCSPLGAFRRVVLPLILPSALTGAALVAIAAATELTATLLLSPTGTSTLATAFWAASDEFDYAGAAPFAAMMILLSAPLTVLMLRQSGITE